GQRADEAPPAARESLPDGGATQEAYRGGAPAGGDQPRRGAGEIPAPRAPLDAPPVVVPQAAGHLSRRAARLPAGRPISAAGALSHAGGPGARAEATAAASGGPGRAGRGDERPGARRRARGDRAGHGRPSPSAPGSLLR